MTNKSDGTKGDRPQVYLDAVGRRYVKAEELFRSAAMRERVRKLSELEDQILTKSAFVHRIDEQLQVGLNGRTSPGGGMMAFASS
ncbi:MAG: hypothetical protein OXE83_04950 [Gammaproteobacteria bacterium]|nr:hypothetical protein [Gammaproteobacteria bacterium]